MLLKGVCWGVGSGFFLVVGEEAVDLVGGVGAGSGEDIAEVGEGVVVVEFAAGHEAIEDGGRSAAIQLTITQSAKRQGLNAFTYLNDIIARISDHPANQLHQLLPDNWTAK